MTGQHLSHVCTTVVYGLLGLVRREIDSLSGPASNDSETIHVFRTHYLENMFRTKVAIYRNAGGRQCHVARSVTLAVYSMPTMAKLCP